MSNHPRPNRINVELQDYKQTWIDYCARHKTTPSEAFRQIVAKLIAAEASAGAPPVVDTVSAGDRGRAARMEIRLTPFEQRAAQALAQHEGFSLPRWITALVRARLEGTPQLGQQELEQLARSNMHILALGRTLNQIARMVHASPDGVSAIPPALVEGTQQAVREHAAVVAKVLSASQRRWSRQ